MKRKADYAFMLLAGMSIALMVTVGAMTYKEAALRIKDIENS